MYLFEIRKHMPDRLAAKLEMFFREKSQKKKSKNGYFGSEKVVFLTFYIKKFNSRIFCVALRNGKKISVSQSVTENS